MSSYKKQNFPFISISYLYHNTSILYYNPLSFIIDLISSLKYGHHKYNYSLEDGPPPAYDSLIDYSNPPRISYGSLFKITHINELIADKTPYCYLDSCEKVYHLMSTVRRHRSKLSPIPSIKEAIKNAYL